MFKKCFSDKIIRNIIISLAITIICFIVGCMIRSVYDSIDNFYISLVVNRIYDSNNYCCYLHPALCSIMGFVSDIFPAIDAFVVCTSAMIFCGIFWLVYLLLSRLDSTFKKIVVCSLIVFCSLKLDIWTTNYTVQAAFLTLCGIITLFVNLYGEKRRIYTVIGTIFVSLGIMLRIQSAALFIPFFLLELVVSIIEHRNNAKEFIKKVCCVFVPCILLIIVLITGTYAVENSEKYSESIRYDEARVQVEDFPMKSWDEVKDDLPNVNETEYSAAIGWLLADTDVIDAEFLSEIADVGSKSKYELSVSGIVSSVRAMISAVFGDAALIIMFGVIFLLVLIIFICSNSNLRKIESILACVGALIIVLFFEFIGRAPSHVYCSVLLALICILVVQMLLYTHPVMKKKKMLIGCVYALIVFFLAAGCLHGIIVNGCVRGQSMFNARDEIAAEKDFLAVKSSDDIYVWGEYDIIFYYMQQGKLPSREIMERHIYIGDWTYGQVYLKNMYNRIGVPNPMKAFVECEHVYYVSEDCFSVKKYLQEHYSNGERITAVQIGEMDGTPVWMFEPKSCSVKDGDEVNGY